MAVDPGLAERCREQLQEMSGFEEKVMFGGLGFLLHGNMACGVLGEKLIVRVGPEKHGAALAQAHVVPFDYTGRSMKGWIMVEPEGLLDDSDLSHWIHSGSRFCLTLPPK